MKILQRRAKQSSPSTTALSGRLSRYQQIMGARWQALPSRDRMALEILLLFLLLFFGGYGGYSVNQMAKKSQTNYQQQVGDYFWLRAQAANIDSAALTNSNLQEGAADLPAASKIETLLNTFGINNAQVIAAGEIVQLSFSHDSQGMVSNALGQLEQQGWQLTQLSMQQDSVTKQIQVQASVTR